METFRNAPGTREPIKGPGKGEEGNFATWLLQGPSRNTLGVFVLGHWSLGGEGVYRAAAHPASYAGILCRITRIFSFREFVGAVTQSPVFTEGTYGSFVNEL